MIPLFVSLRKKLGKKPSVKDFTTPTEGLALSGYAALDKDLKGDVDRAFYKGEEVYLTHFSESNCCTMGSGYCGLGDEMCRVTSNSRKTLHIH
jgi:hypothetical protein